MALGGNRYPFRVFIWVVGKEVVAWDVWMLSCLKGKIVVGRGGRLREGFFDSVFSGLCLAVSG